MTAKETELRNCPIVQDFVKHIARWLDLSFSSTTRAKHLQQAAGCLTVMTTPARRAAMAQVTLTPIQDERLTDAYSDLYYQQRKR